MTQHMRIRYPLRKLAEEIERTLRDGEAVAKVDYSDLDMIAQGQRKLEGCIAALYIEWLKLQEMRETEPEAVVMNTDAYEEFVQANACPRGGCE